MTRTPVILTIIANIYSIFYVQSLLPRSSLISFNICKDKSRDSEILCNKDIMEPTFQLKFNSEFVLLTTILVPTKLYLSIQTKVVGIPYYKCVSENG